MDSPKRDCNIIYNYARSPLSKTPDTDLSLRFTESLVDQCEGSGLTCYYHDRDALPGKLLFQELTEVIKTSKFTILILTKGFVDDCYSQYRRATALNMLIEKKQYDTIIPVAIGLLNVPDELKGFIPEHFSDKPSTWDSSSSSWMKILKRLKGQEAVQEFGDNQQRSEINSTFVAETTPSLKTFRDTQLRSEINSPFVAETTPTLSISSEVSEGVRMIEDQPATVQLHSREASSNQHSSMYLDESPTIRPPALINPTRSADLSSSNQNSSPAVNHTATAQAVSQYGHSNACVANRQISLSSYEDLTVDGTQINSPEVQPGRPNYTDSGYAHSTGNSNLNACMGFGASDSLEDISELESTTADTMDSSAPIGTTEIMADTNGPIQDASNNATSSLVETEHIVASVSSQTYQKIPYSPDYGSESVPMVEERQVAEIIKTNTTENINIATVPGVSKSVSSSTSVVKDGGESQTGTSGKTSLVSTIFQELLLWISKPECAYKGSSI